MIKIISVAIFFIMFVLSAYGVDAKTSYECCVSHAVNPSTCIGRDNTSETTCIADVFPPAKYFDDPSAIINTLLPNIVLIAGIVMFLLVIVAGFQIITSAGSGDANTVGKWKNILLYGIIGFLIVLFAYAIVQVVGQFSGVDVLNPEESLK